MARDFFLQFESLASCIESEKSLSCTASFSLNQAMSLVVRSAKPLSHQISGTLSSFCEGEPLEAEGVGGMAEFRDEVCYTLPWDPWAFIRKLSKVCLTMRAKGMSF